MGNILILEDEVILRKNLKAIIMELDPEAKIYESGSVIRGFELLNEVDMDILLLDIQLEDGNGLDFAKEVRKIDRYKLTHIVFITAVPTHAIMAFSETHCYSYIVKPFDKEQLKEALYTLIHYGYKAKVHKEGKLELHLKNCIFKVDMAEILYIEASNQKLYVHTRQDTIAVPNVSLKKMKASLNDTFIQVHKAFIINKEAIKAIHKAEKTIQLHNTDTYIPIGRVYYKELIGETI
ncbi:LytR/AlgR family response regulator transcription factor [Petrocella sp. FN5]|uniref:LytR/AlgR family response regulator transcription factor n=1 Tax=Petrocella sp. FN5 TaxID=3032002 RepID=UPI0023DAB480|nr:LytTR family DNA-binding domain-containing protein [Petrocella sp. FN5]MDF1617402.1 LytTR family DNA-binding domain-containing protein [Petrocella sp. FN5]